MPTVGSNLSRLKAAGDLVNLDVKWALAAWYPAARRAELAEKPKGSRRRKYVKRGKAAAAKSTTSKPTPEQIARIRELQKSGKKLSDIAKEVGVHHLAVWSILKPHKVAA